MQAKDKVCCGSDEAVEGGWMSAEVQPALPVRDTHNYLPVDKRRVLSGGFLGADSTGGGPKECVLFSPNPRTLPVWA